MIFEVGKFAKLLELSKLKNKQISRIFLISKTKICFEKLSILKLFAIFPILKFALWYKFYQFLFHILLTSKFDYSTF